MINVANNLPKVMGTVCMQEPLLAGPFVTIELGEPIVQVICGVVGPISIIELRLSDADQ